MEEHIDILDFLQKNVKPASGCTEIGAIALGSSVCMQALAKDGKDTSISPDPRAFGRIEVTLDKKMYKNAHSVTIPNAGNGKGIALASALGVFLDAAGDGMLELFNHVTDDILHKACAILPLVWVSIDFNKESPYILTTITYGGKTQSSLITGTHTNVSLVPAGDAQEVATSPLATPAPLRIGLPLAELVRMVDRISATEEAELQKTIDLNMALVDEGMKGTYGMGIVKSLLWMQEQGDLGDGIYEHIKIAVAAAVEARMGGAPLSAMSTSGSGNMGITASVPIIIAARERNLPMQKVYRALLLSHFVVRLSADNMGDLSILCGANNKSAFGAAAGITYLLGGSAAHIRRAINAVASNLIGSACDGAKYNCALKAMTSACIAWESALLSLYGATIAHDGIVDDSIEKTFENISLLSKGMNALDDMIIDIIRAHDTDQDAC